MLVLFVLLVVVVVVVDILLTAPPVVPDTHAEVATALCVGESRATRQCGLGVQRDKVIHFDRVELAFTDEEGQEEKPNDVLQNPLHSNV